MSRPDPRADPDGMRGWYSHSIAKQRQFRVVMHTPDGDVSIYMQAGSIETVIDQVKNRRIATPPGMRGFDVSEVSQPDAVNQTAPDHFHLSLNRS